MDIDFLEQLADLDVPPPPAEFDTQLHDRVNRSLVAVQLIDLVLFGVPWALGHFALAVFGLIRCSLLGRFDGDRKKNSPDGM